MLPGHPEHGLVHDLTIGHDLGLAGHAAFETYSVLTRLPPPLRREARDVSHLLRTTFPATVHLSSQASAALAGTLAELAISGGAVYDGLIAAAALEAGLPLLSFDGRAARTYRAIGVELVPS